MIGRRAAVGLALLCACLFAAFAAQGASAAGHGQTAFTCANVGAGNGIASDANCETTVAGGEFGHVAIAANTPTSITLSNDGNAVLTVKELHGFSDVTITCTTVSGTGTMENSEPTTGFMKASGSGTISFSGCTTNQAGCTSVTVASTAAKAETVEGLKENMAAGSGMGLKFSPSSGAKFTSVTFNGTCGLHNFGAIPVEGSAIATANGEPQGMGAKAVFLNEHVTEEEAGHTTNEMSGLIVGEKPAYLAGTGTIKGPNGNSLVTTTS